MRNGLEQRCLDLVLKQKQMKGHFIVFYGDLGIQTADILIHSRPHYPAFWVLALLCVSSFFFVLFLKQTAKDEVITKHQKQNDFKAFH